jgi:DNA-binding beta-propeller fold protein YncE
MMLLLATLVALAQDPPTATHLGKWERSIHGLDRPEAVLIDGEGHLWIAEAGAGRVRSFDREGRERVRIEDGLVEPVDLADAGQGVLVVDRGARALLQVLPDGSIERVVGAPRLGSPHAGAFDRRGFWRAYEDVAGIVCTASDATEPSEHAAWIPLTPPSLVSDIAVLPDGGLLVLDAGEHLLRRYDEDLDLIATTGGFGYFESLFASPGGVDVAAGRVFVADSENHRVQVFDLAKLVPRDGPALPVSPLYTFGGHATRPREGKGRLHYPADVAVADDRSWGAVAEPWNDRVQIFGRGEGPRPPKDPLRVGLGQASPHFGRRVAIDGTLMTIVQPETQQVEVYDLRVLSEERRNDPIKLSNFGGLGERLGSFRRPMGMDLRLADLSLLVCDAGSRRLVEVVLDVDPEGELEQNFEMARFVRMLQLEAAPVAVQRANGEVFVLLAASSQGQVLVLDERTWEERARLLQPDAAADRPTDMAVSPDGQLLYVACASGVRVLSRDGEELGALGGEVLDEPYGVTLTPNGTVVVTDAGAHEVMVLTQAGEVAARWGSKGLRRGELYRPAGVAVSGAGELYVIDHANHRGIITDLAGGFVHAFGSRSYTRPANKPDTYAAEDYEE